MDHLNTWEDDPVNGDGTIYDYLAIWEDGQVKLQSTGAYDSVDSYAALFLIVADCYAQKVDPELLKARSADVRRVADALLRGIGENGLAFVKKEYPVQYLMDNAEVYAGLLAGARLLQQISPEDETAPLMQQAAQRVEQAFEELLWNEQAGMYEIGLMDDGEPIGPVSWAEFYPDSTAQLFPIAFGMIEPKSERAQQLYSTFSSKWNWAEFEHVKSQESTFYWCVVGYVAAKQGDEASIQQYIRNYEELLEYNGREYPLYTGDAGWMALACGQMESNNRRYSGFGTIKELINRLFSGLIQSFDCLGCIYLSKLL